jgi:membrane protease YdiL (CAAX protease family)
MSTNPEYIRNPFLFFVSKLLLLVGLVLAFMGAITFLGIGLSIVLFDINFFTEPQLMYAYETNPAVIPALKFIQSMYGIGVFLVPALIFARNMKEPVMEFNQAHQFGSPIFWILAIAITFLSIPFLSIMIEWNQHIKLPDSLSYIETRLKLAEESAEALTKAFTAAETFNVYLVNLLVVALIPALCEEFLFRGALMKFLLIFARNKHNAIFLSAFIFSAFHGQFYGFFPRLFMGVILGYIVMYSGSIWPAIMAHFVNNAFAVSAVYFHWNESAVSFLHDDYQFPIYISILSLLICSAIIVIMSRLHNNKIWYNGE